MGTKARLMVAQVLFMALLLSGNLQAQHRGTRFQLQARKQYRLADKVRLNLQGQLQLNQEVMGFRFENPANADPFFNEIDFIDPDFLRPEGSGRYDDDDDYDDEDENDEGDNDDDGDDKGDDDDDDDDEDDEDYSDDDDDDNPGNNGAGIDGSPTPNDVPAPNGQGRRLVWNPDFSELRAATSIALRVDLPQNFRLIGGYQYNIRPERNTQRVFTDIAHRFRPKKSDLTLISRIRWQTDFRERNDRLVMRNHIRARVHMILRKKKEKLNPFANAELMYRVNEDRNGFNRYRLAVGADWRLTKWLGLRATYVYQRRLDTEELNQSSVLNIATRIRL